MRILRVTALLAAALTFAGCDIESFADSQRYRQDFHYSYALDPTGTVSVEGFNGAVEITGWDQNTVDISGTKYASTQQAMDALRISIDSTPGSVSIRAVRPADRIRSEGARFIIKAPRKAVLTRIITSNGAIRTQDGAGPSRFRTSNSEIRVQNLAGSLDAQTSNGRVELLDVNGDAIVETSNGHIRASGVRGAFEATTSNAGVTAQIEGAGKSVRAQTSNGSVDLTLPANYANNLKATTSNSSITLHLPGEPNAQISARTSNASIQSDFDLKTRGEISRTRLEGTIGNGGPLFDISTSNGGIRLMRM